MVNVSNAVPDGEKKQDACGACSASVTWVLLATGASRVRTMVERCARGVGNLAIEEPLFAFGAEQMPGATPAGNTNWRKHVCKGARSFSAEGITRKSRENTAGSPSISYRPSGSDNSRRRK